jgi:hypothetical protein
LADLKFPTIIQMPPDKNTHRQQPCHYQGICYDMPIFHLIFALHTAQLVWGL